MTKEIIYFASGFTMWLIVLVGVILKKDKQPSDFACIVFGLPLLTLFGPLILFFGGVWWLLEAMGGEYDSK